MENPEMIYLVAKFIFLLLHLYGAKRKYAKVSIYTAITLQGLMLMLIT